MSGLFSNWLLSELMTLKRIKAVSCLRLRLLQMGTSYKDVSSPQTDRNWESNLTTKVEPAQVMKQTNE